MLCLRETVNTAKDGNTFLLIQQVNNLTLYSCRTSYVLFEGMIGQMISVQYCWAQAHMTQVPRAVSGAVLTQSIAINSTGIKPKDQCFILRKSIFFEQNLTLAYVRLLFLIKRYLSILIQPSPPTYLPPSLNDWVNNISIACPWL